MNDPHKVLKELFGYDSFRGEQETIIQSALKGQSSLVLMPTGMGKSLCYQVPARLLDGLTLVISPLIALMKDQVDVAEKRGFRVCFINSSLTGAQREARYRGLTEKKYELVYVTPERFQKPEFLKALKANTVSLLAIDEAHCVSQWGHDFRPDYSRIGEFRGLMGNPPTMALTATATPEVQKDILTQLNLKEGEIQLFAHGMERQNLWLQVKEAIGLEEKANRLIELRKKIQGPMIAYFSLIDTIKKTSHILAKKNMSHLQYHGQLNDRERKQRQNTFMKSDNALMLATNAFGLGVDKADVRSVVHMEVPGSLEAYYQEVGRAGRDGKSSHCALIYDGDDLAIQMDFIKWANPDAGFVYSVYRLIEANPTQVNGGGADYLREKMNFYNRRDFRVETSLNLLERFGCIEGEIEKGTLKAIEPPSGALKDDPGRDARLKNQQKKLLALMNFCKSSSCRKAQVYEYFGLEGKPCGFCDKCQSTPPEL